MIPKTTKKQQRKQEKMYKKSQTRHRAAINSLPKHGFIALPNVDATCAEYIQTDHTNDGETIMCSHKYNYLRPAVNPSSTACSDGALVPTGGVHMEWDTALHHDAPIGELFTRYNFASTSEIFFKLAMRDKAELYTLTSMIDPGYEYVITGNPGPNPHNPASLIKLPIVPPKIVKDTSRIPTNAEEALCFFNAGDLEDIFVRAMHILYVEDLRDERDDFTYKTRAGYSIACFESGTCFADSITRISIYFYYNNVPVMVRWYHESTPLDMSCAAYECASPTPALLYIVPATSYFTDLVPHPPKTMRCLVDDDDQEAWLENPLFKSFQRKSMGWYNGFEHNEPNEFATVAPRLRKARTMVQEYLKDPRANPPPALSTKKMPPSSNPLPNPPVNPSNMSDADAMGLLALCQTAIVPRSKMCIDARLHADDLANRLLVPMYTKLRAVENGDPNIRRAMQRVGHQWMEWETAAAGMRSDIIVSGYRNVYEPQSVRDSLWNLFEEEVMTEIAHALGCAREIHKQKVEAQAKYNAAQAAAKAAAKAAVIAKRRWKWAVHLVLKENRSNQLLSRAHREESERQQRVRAAAKAAKEAKAFKEAQTRSSTTMPGIAPAFGKGADSQTASERAAAAAKRAVRAQEAKEKILKHREEKRQEEIKNAAAEAERERLLEVGRAMMRNQKEEIVQIVEDMHIR